MIQIAAGVIAKADREHPADAVLRATLKETKGISREEGGVISRAVFAYYRWLGWLDAHKPWESRLQRALELDRSFQSDPANFPEGELDRAIPGWVREQMCVSTAWLRTLQTEPELWLRARPGQGAKLAETLGDCQVAGAGCLAETVRYLGGKDLFRTVEFHAGEFEVQDISSQMVGVLCRPQPGGTWWDACAGEGEDAAAERPDAEQGLIWASDCAE